MNSQKRRAFLGVLSAAVLSWVLFSVSAQLGLRVPAERELAGQGGALLDYSTPRSGLFDQLTREFVARILGIQLDDARRETTGPLFASTVRASGSFGTERLTDVHPLTNDHRSEARNVPGIPYTAKSDTRRATREPNEPTDCASVGESTVWYRYRATADIGLIANTFGSNYATALGVFESSAGDLRRVGCDTDSRGNAILAFPAKKDTVYFFQVIGIAGGGNLVFNLDPQGVTTLASVSLSGGPGDAASFEPTMSGDGRFIAFTSQSSNMGCPGNPCFPYQSYVRDLTLSTTTIVSVDSSGRHGNFDSIAPFISGNGRYVSFESNSNNLVPGDTNNAADIFVHDLSTRRTERVSVSSSGAQLVDNSAAWPGARSPAMSWDGRFVAFESRASNLVPGDTNGAWDAFVHDRSTGVTERVSVNSQGQERGEPYRSPDEDAGRLTEMNPSISGDGRFVAFRSYAANLAPGDSGTNVDTFVHDRVKRTTERVSVSSSGQEGFDGGSSTPGRKQLSFDGRFVAFNSYASNLAPGDTGFDPDAFVHDRLTHRTIRVSVSSAGDEALSTPASETGGTTISEDGRYVGFHSDAPNLVPRDDNGVFDVFIHDLITGTTLRVSVSATGEAMQGSSSHPCLSANGARVAFESAAVAPTESAFSYLPVGDQYQVYLHERYRGG